MTVSSPMMIATSSRTSRTLLRSTSAEDSQNFSVGGRASAGLTSLEKERLSLNSECSRRVPMYFLVFYADELNRRLSKRKQSKSRVVRGYCSEIKDISQKKSERQ